MKNAISVRVPDVLSIRDEFFSPLEQQFDKFFRNFFQDSNLDAIRSNSGYPKIDIFEDDVHWGIKAAVPGVKAEDLSVEVLDSVDSVQTGKPKTVVISGQMSSEFRSEDKKTKMFYRELHKSKFRRDVYLPPHINGEPEAELHDGILTLKWKHNKEKPPEPKKVKINVT